MSDRKLLEETAKVLETYLGPYVGPGTSKRDLYALKDKLTAALAAPEPDAMEIADEIFGIYDESRSLVNRLDGPSVDREASEIMHKADSEAAALIADYGRVPRAMLEELVEQVTGGLIHDAEFDAISAKYDVKLEE